MSNKQIPAHYSMPKGGPIPQTSSIASQGFKAGAYKSHSEVTSTNKASKGTSAARDGKFITFTTKAGKTVSFTRRPKSTTPGGRGRKRSRNQIA